eukprot:4579971-Amphidinium_carterae.1
MVLGQRRQDGVLRTVAPRRGWEHWAEVGGLFPLCSGDCPSRGAECQVVLRGTTMFPALHCLG